MGSELAFNAAKSVYSMYGALLKDVAQESGMEHAVGLHARRGVDFGAMLAQMVKDTVGDDEFNMQAVVSVLSGVYEKVGLVADIEATDTSAKTEVFKCPMYEGFMLAGWSHEEIGTMCNNMAAAEADEIKKTFPHLAVCATFRPAPDEACVEEVRSER
jgi:hypothetical protein